MEQEKIRNSLFILRMGVTIVMLVWTVDKFLNPAHAAAVFEKFYFWPGLGETTAYIIGAIQAVIVIAFAGAFMKKFSYLAILVLHGISTFSSYAKYLDPFTGPNLLFFAAWPMLAACFVLWYLQDLDTKFSLQKS